MKTMPSPFTIALSRVMTCWDGTSSTCSIMFMRRPMRSTNGVRMWMPGVRVFVYLPNRSTVNSRPWGTILITLNRKMSAKTANITKKISEKFIRPSDVETSLSAGRRLRHRIRFPQHDITVSHPARHADDPPRFVPIHLGQRGLEREKCRFRSVIGRHGLARDPARGVVDQDIMTPRFWKQAVHHVDQTDQFRFDAGFLAQLPQRGVGQALA